MTHICIGKLTSIGSDNGLSPGRRQTIIWTNAWILLIGPLGTNFSEILIKIETCSFKKTHLKVSSAKWRPFCLGLNVLIYEIYLIPGVYLEYVLFHQCCQFNPNQDNISSTKSRPRLQTNVAPRHQIADNGIFPKNSCIHTWGRQNLVHAFH